MKIASRSLLFVLALALAAAVLSACGGKAGDRLATTATGNDESDGGGGSASLSSGAPKPCRGEAEVAAAVGSPVRSKPYKFGRYYETADAAASVVIMSISPSRADLLLEQMRSEAKPYGTELVAIDVGERGYAWSSPAYSQGFAVAGDWAYMLEITTLGGDGDRKDAVIWILKMMLD